MFADIPADNRRIKNKHSKLLSLIGLQGQFLLSQHACHLQYITYRPSSLKSSEKAEYWGPKGETQLLKQNTNPLQSLLC